MDIDLDKYRELYLDTFLHFACDAWRGEGRYRLYLPFVEDGWKYATDGRILMAVPTDEPNTHQPSATADRKFPKQVAEIVSPCFGEWKDESKTWPQISPEEIISDGEDGPEYIVLDWDREIVTQSHYYWILERLSQSINRQLEFRIATIEYRIADSETAIQFRTTERNALGERSLVGVLMLVKVDPERKSILTKQLDFYRSRKEREAKKDSEDKELTTQQEQPSE